MIERLTEKASKALELAQEESRRLGHNFVGTEQILIGLCAENTGVAAKSLKSMGANLRDLRTEVERIIGHGPGSETGAIPFTPRARRVMELSWEEARHLGDNYIGTEHLLLGLIREGKGSASKVLACCNIDAANLRAHIYRLLDTKKASVAISSKTTASETPALDQFSVDLSQAGRDEQLDPVVERDSEINRVIRILGRRTRANPLIIGERGVGKSAIVAGLAARIENARVPDYLLTRRILRLDIPYLLTHRDAGSLLKECLDEAQMSNIILAVEEMHLLLDADAKGAEQDASRIINWFLAQGKVNFIGILPLCKYRKISLSPAAPASHFQMVLIQPPRTEEALLMLAALKERMEKHYDLAISEAAIEKAVSLSEELVPHAFLPGKAVDVLEEACQLVSLRRPGMVASIKSDLSRVRRDKDVCILKQQFAQATSLRDQEASLCENLQRMQQMSEKPVVSPDDVAEVLNHWPVIS